MRLREAIYVLERRLGHLTARVSEADSVGRDLSFDKQEASALRLAIHVLSEARRSAIDSSLPAGSHLATPPQQQPTPNAFLHTRPDSEPGRDFSEGLPE